MAGRQVDRLFRPGGRALSPFALTRAIGRTTGLGRYQFQQTGDSTYRLVHEPVTGGPDTDPATLRSLRSRLEHLLGTGTELTIEAVDRLPAEPGGKHRYIRDLRG